MATKNDWLQYFRDNLLEMMEEQGFTQEELAKRAHLSQASINAYISMRKIPSSISIANIAYALRCEVSDLIDMGALIEEA